jgi:hypothetical protein
MTRRKPVPLVLPKTDTPIYAAVVRAQGFAPRNGQADHAIEHARKERDK